MGLWAFRPAAVLAVILVPLLSAPSWAADDKATEYEPESDVLSAQGADTCLGCHNDDSMLVIFRTAHGQQADPESPMAQLQCENCHGPAGEHAGRRATRAAHRPVIDFGPDAAAEVDAQNGACMNCHADDVSLTWSGSVHERNETACANCHTVHASADPVGLQSQQADVCFDCHQQQRADSQKPSAHPIRFDLMVCTDCHSPHASVAGGQLKRDTLNELCLSCHAEFRGPVLFDHAPVSEDCS